MPHLHRFFCEDLSQLVSPDGASPDIALSEEETHHALHVIRARVGDEVVLFDGTGGEAPGHVAHVGKREVRVQAASFRVAPEPAVRLTLVQGWLLREKAVEYVVQHGTELGVNRFCFFRARHSEKMPKESEKWRRLAIETCKQCGRLWLPSFEVAGSLEAALQGLPDRVAIATQDEAPTPLRTFVGDGVPKELALVVGPEGDFSADEVACAKARGAVPVSLGSATYRAEVAAILGSALLLYECGEIGPRTARVLKAEET